MREKRKRNIICILSLTIMLLFFLMAKENNYGKRFNDFVVSEEKYNAIIKTHNESKNSRFPYLSKTSQPPNYYQMAPIPVFLLFLEKRYY